MKADVVAFLAAAPAQSAALAPRVASAGTPAPGMATASPAGIASTGIATASSSIGRSALAQGGDPVLPPALRRSAPSASPRGAALAALVARKIAARSADPYR
jgi:hypothetical protein